jgi:hypothetical protein
MEKPIMEKLPTAEWRAEYYGGNELLVGGFKAQFAVRSIRQP